MAPILLLDEPTSALDSESESQVRHALDALMKDRTVMLITHRNALIGSTNRVVTINKGAGAKEESTEQFKKRIG